MSYVVDGTLPVTLPEAPTQDANGRLTVTQRIVGLRASIDLLVPAGLPYRITPIEGTPLAELEIEYAGGTGSVETALSVTFLWRVQTSTVPLEEHPLFASDIAALTDVQRSELKRLVSGTDPLDVVPAYVTGDLATYFTKMLSGVTTYSEPRPVLVHQARYQAGAGYRPAVADVGKVYSTSALKSALDIGFWDPLLANSLPSGQWLAEDLSYSTVSTGEREFQQSFAYKVVWDADLYTHVA